MKLFKDMDRAEARVAIAQDFLASIRSKRVIVVTGYYLYLPPYPASGDGVQLQSILASTPCDACMVGGLFASVVARDNDFSCYVYSDGAVSTPGADSAIVRLSAFFAREELARLEAAFESGTGKPVSYGVGDVTSWAKVFGYHTSAEERAIALCNFIVDTKGDNINAQPPFDYEWNYELVSNAHWGIGVVMPGEGA